MNDFFVDGIMNQSPYPMWISDSKGTLIHINRACLEMLNISESEVIGRYNILQDDIVREQGFLPLVSKVYEEGETARFEIRYDTSKLECLSLQKQASVTLDVTIFPIKDGGGAITHAVIQHIDITKRREAEDALKQANAELEARVQERTAELKSTNQTFQTLCDSAPIGIYMTKADGSTIYTNPRVQEIFGLTPEEGLGLGWSTVIHPEDRAETRLKWLETATSGGTFQHEYRLNCNGTQKWVRSLAEPVKNHEGTITGYVGTVEDITELRHRHEEAIKAQKLESLGLLAGGIAHDFNNILSVILGYVSLARTEIDDPESAKTRLKGCEKAVMRARDVTQQLLTFARGGEPVKKAVKLNTLLKEAADFGMEDGNIRYHLNLCEELFPVWADEGQMSQVVQNLLLNARQAMPDGGTITITSENVTFDDRAKAMVKFSVRDAGVGIPLHDRTKIFDPFFTTKQQGSGLGLANCYSIIRKHKGSIAVDSEMGFGSTFTVYLPASHTDTASEVKVPPVAHHGRGPILLVDDDPLVREVGHAMLSQLGYDTESAADGGEAVKMYVRRKNEGAPYAAVIMDLTIPDGIGGKEAMSLLTVVDPKVKAVVSSGYSDDPVLANYRDYGFRSVLAKPYTQLEMRQVLHELLISDAP